MSPLALSYCPGKLVLDITLWVNEHVSLLMERNIMVSGAPSGPPCISILECFHYSALCTNNLHHEIDPGQRAPLPAGAPQMLWALGAQMNSKYISRTINLLIKNQNVSKSCTPGTSGTETIMCCYASFSFVAAYGLSPSLWLTSLFDRQYDLSININNFSF